MGIVGNLRAFSLNNFYNFLIIVKYTHCLHLIYLHRKQPEISLIFIGSQVLSLRFFNHILYC